ncbi:MAG: 6-carboxytetrahydropterin synthase QueD [Alicyclobacillaceae bacterium]|nr:6-carboxytetrahydropterin synthase QueD [Alicyclobacillaceae bacterium]
MSGERSLRYRMRPVSVAKQFTFDAAHRLEAYEGKCAELHGHTYRLEVEIKGLPDERGLVVDFNEIKSLVDRVVLRHFDHRYLNELVAFNTTAENLVIYIYEEIARALRPLTEQRAVTLERVRLWETPTTYAEVHREDMTADETQ